MEGRKRSENRRHTRTVLTLPIEYWRSHDGRGQFSHAIDVSEGGLKAYVAEPVENGQFFRLQFSFPAADAVATVETLVQVVWKNEAAGKYGRSLAGVKFVSMAPGETALSPLIRAQPRSPCPARPFPTRTSSVARKS
jgi:hypothetical protein